jgi:hypothetical protein
MSKARSGGGITSRVNRKVAQNVGPARTNIVSVAATDMLGQSLAFKRPDLIKGTAPQVPMGNAVATNIGKGGPGTGRVTHHCGSQGTHGPTTGTTRPARDILSEYGPEKSRG